MRTLKVLLLLALTKALLSCEQEAGTPPNVLFIAIDDLKPTLGCYGDAHVLSPHIDQVAQQGTVFLNNHCQQAVCGPSRASLLTGRYPDEIRVWGFYSFREGNPGIVTLPQYFRQQGYTTVNISKIFDYRTVGAGMDSISWSWPYFPSGGNDLPYYAEESGPVAAYFYQAAHVKETFEEMKLKAREEGGNPNAMTHQYYKPATECLDLPDDAYKDGVFAERALEDLERLAAGGKPFFLGVGFERPHLPFTAPKRYWDLYERENIPLEPFRDHARGDQNYFYTTSNELRSYTEEDGSDAWGKLKDSIPLTTAEQRKLIHGYWAAVTYIDAQVGKIMDKLDELGLRENTIVVIWGDHGWHLGDHGLWGKATNFEQATRSPLIIAAPGMTGGSTHAATEFVDLYPTLCELAGLPLPEKLSGESLLPILQGREGKAPSYAVSQFTRDKRMGYAIRDGRYRYVEWMKVGRHSDEGAPLEAEHCQFFDYESDPLEQVNACGHPEYAAEEARMKKALHSWLEELDYPYLF